MNDFGELVVEVDEVIFLVTMGSVCNFRHNLRRCSMGWRQLRAFILKRRSLLADMIHEVVRVALDRSQELVNLAFL